MKLKELLYSIASCLVKLFINTQIPSAVKSGKWIHRENGNSRGTGSWFPLDVRHFFFAVVRGYINGNMILFAGKSRRSGKGRLKKLVEIEAPDEWF